MNSSTPHTALITGATAGFGRAAARQFIAAGWQVIATGRRADRLAELQAELGENLHTACFDMRDDAAMRAALDALPERFAGIDLLLNNAGLAPVSYTHLDVYKRQNQRRCRALVPDCTQAGFAAHFRY